MRVWVKDRVTTKTCGPYPILTILTHTSASAWRIQVLALAEELFGEPKSFIDGLLRQPVVSHHEEAKLLDIGEPDFRRRFLGI